MAACKAARLPHNRGGMANKLGGSLLDLQGGGLYRPSKSLCQHLVPPSLLGHLRQRCTSQKNLKYRFVRNVTDSHREDL